jgi:hypothetical protein
VILLLLAPEHTEVDSEVAKVVPDPQCLNIRPCTTWEDLVQFASLAHSVAFVDFVMRDFDLDLKISVEEDQSFSGDCFAGGEQSRGKLIKGEVVCY